MQPYFLPYRNYYGLISKADAFVIFDDVQFTRKWQQRNEILCRDGSKKWLTVPIISKRPSYQFIKEVEIDNKQLWQGRMLARIRLEYNKHPFFEDIYPELDRILRKPVSLLIELTIPLLIWSTSKIGVDPPEYYRSSHLGDTHLGRNERLVGICEKLHATHYLVGPAAKSYLNEHLFKNAGIHVDWHQNNHPEYPQLNAKRFDHFVSIIDLLMNCGPNSAKYFERLNEKEIPKIDRK